MHEIFYRSLLVSHPIGLLTDALQHFKNTGKENIPLQPTFIYKNGAGLGGSSITDEVCMRYLKDKFQMEEQQNVIVPHLEHLDKKSLNYKLTSILTSKILSTSGNFLFTSVNLYKHLEEFGMSTGVLKKEFDGNLKDSLNTMILYPSGYAAVIVITLPNDRLESLHQLILRADANVKAYQMLHQEKLTKESNKIMVISVIGAVHQQKLENSPLCNQCNRYNLVIYKDNFEENFGKWWEIFCEKMNEFAGNHTIMHDLEFIKETASRLVLLVGLTSDKFPSLFAKCDERICKIRLNEQQREVLFFSPDDPRKIITGE